MDRLQAAVTGAIVGGTLGAPLRGLNTFRKLNFYEPVPTRMAANTALDSWIVAAEHRAAGGRPEGYCWKMPANHDYRIDETAFGLHNLSLGLSAPLSGAFENPLPNGSQALGRAVVWGLLFPDDPDQAALFAYNDASFDHAQEGVWAAMAVARMASIAKPGATVSQLVKAATSILPPNSLSLKAVSSALGSFNQGRDLAEVYTQLPLHLGTRDALNASLNLAFVMMGLLYGENDPTKAMLVTAGCGGASDQTTVAVGAIASAVAGGTPDELVKPLGDVFVAGHGLKRLSPPATWAEFEERIRFARHEIAPEPVDELQPELPVSSDLAPDVPVGTPTAEPRPPVTLDPSADLLKLVAGAPDGAVAVIDHLLFRVQYVDSPVAQPGKTVKVILSVSNPEPADREVELRASAPEGWDLASKLTSFRLKQGESSSFPIVVQASPLSPAGSVKVHFGTYQLSLPILSPQQWYSVGPFVNHEGTGFEKNYRCEDVQNTKEVFNGRSDLPVSWTLTSFPGVLFDLEPDFKKGPGVIYLYTKVRFPEPGKYRIVCAASTGCIVWVNHQQLVKYHDMHTPIPRAIQPYVASFDAAGPVEIMVKVLRNLQEVLPTVIYFLAEDGSVVQPVEFYPMT